jgi:hypothetical protein
VPGPILGLGADVKHDSFPLLETLVELGCSQELNLVSLAQVLAREDGHFGDMMGRDVTDGTPQLGDTLARKSVEDAIALAS